MATRINDTATKIQVWNLRNEVNEMKLIIGDLLFVLKETHPELALKYINYIEASNVRN